jgi:hypothetical protein
MLIPTVDLIKHYTTRRASAQDLSGVQSTGDWLALLQFARRQWVSPIIYRVIEPDQSRLPPDIVTSFQTDYYLSARQNTLLLSALGQVLPRLATAGIDVVVMRGASWAESLYHDIGLRPMADVDLLIRAEAIQVVAQVMSDLGYRLRETVDYCAQFQLGDDRTFIEVHWSIGSGSPCFNVTFGSLWSERQPLLLGGEVTFQLSPEDAVLLTSFHVGFQHCFAVRLMSFLDVYLLTAGPSARLDWDKLVERAQMFKLSHLLFAVLELTGRIFRHEFPPNALRSLRAHCTRAQLRWLRAFDPVERLERTWQDRAGLHGGDLGFSPLVRFLWTYRGKDKLRLLAATLQADESPMSPQKVTRHFTGLALRRVPRLIKRYAWPSAWLK